MVRRMQPGRLYCFQNCYHLFHSIGVKQKLDQAHSGRWMPNGELADRPYLYFLVIFSKLSILSVAVGVLST